MPFVAISRLLVGVYVVGLAAFAQAVSPNPGEFQARNAWFQRVFSFGTNVQTTPCLKLLEEDVPDSVTRGRSWRGTPYQLGTNVYTHGLAFNASKRILVDLGSPAKRFTADVGLENNDDTRRGEGLGQGSVTFHVIVGGQEKFASKVLRRKDGPVRVDVPLGGATQFEIRVGDGGDGRGWDQALWAEAMIELESGPVLRLQDLAWATPPGANPFAFSFKYDGKDAGSLLRRWQSHSKAETAQDDSLKELELSLSDPNSGMRLTVETTEFADFPAVEWLLRFTNAGPADTSILEDIQALDAGLPVPFSGQATIHWAKGGVASFDDFAPQLASLKPGGTLNLQSGEGRSSSQVLPFFNLEGANGGVILAIGWSGEWRAAFGCDRGEVRARMGLERTHLLLHQGESIRSPRMLALFYEGDRWRGQNLLRQFLLAHHRPRLNGHPVVAPITCGNWGGTRAEVHLDNIQQIINQQLPIAYYWIDAEWYGSGSWPVNVGTWQMKRELYPNGFKPLSEALRHSGRELMLWFEPERVFKNTAWHQQHPEWLLGPRGDNSLLNLGIPSARKFLTDFISARIDEFGLGCYRQDFNIDPLPYWREADAPDRQGMTEMRYIEGLYAFWDELLKRHPGLLIDNCASGGRRIDLETVGRATPFWRTDGPRDAIAHQCHTYGLLPWVPLSATSQDRAGDDYEFRSSMCSSLCLNWWVSGDAPAERIPSDFPFPWARATLGQYLQIRDYFYGDFYPLTGYSQERDVWIGYQLDRPDLGKGLVVALRRPESPYESARLRLHGVGPSSTYHFSDLDTRAESHHKGAELLATGLEVAIPARPGAVLMLYERQPGT